MKHFEKIIAVALAAVLACAGTALAAELSFGSYEVPKIEFDPSPIEVNIGSSLDFDMPTVAPFEISPIEVDISADLHIDLPEVVEFTPESIKVNIDADLSFEVPQVAEYVPMEAVQIYADLLPYLPETELADLSGMTEIQAADFAQLQFDVVNAVAAAFQIAGIDAAFNTSSGIITIDSSLLYATDKYEVTETGKNTIRNIMNVLCSVLTQDEYRDSVGSVIIAGHTDSDGSHDYNQQLSERRAGAVKDFCLSSECGLDEAAWLSDKLVAQGYSYDRLIRDANGNEDKAASRRVELRFIMKLPD